MKRHYKATVRFADRSAADLLRRQNRDLNHPEQGGIFDSNGLHEPYAAIGAFLQFASVCFCPDSVYWKSQACLEAMEGILGFIRRKSREDGTQDNLISNFKAAPGFEMHAMARAYRILLACVKTDQEKKLEKQAYAVLKELARGLYNGGFHTPNHRWVDAAGLLLAHSITGEEHLKEKALRYLSEGIDIDEYGEYTERSPGMYNAVNNHALMIIAEELNRDDLLAHVKKNMDLLFRYIEPDGSIFTQNSRRKDKGETSPGQKFFPDAYFPIYAKGAKIFGDGRYAAFADYICRLASERGSPGPSCLWMYLLDPDLLNFDPPREVFPQSYESFYPKSGIYRRKDGDVSLSILENHPHFLFVQKGRLRCYVRMCASFFAIAQFRGARIRETENGYEMSFSAEADYRMPMRTDTAVWAEMNHEKRERRNRQVLEMFLRVVPTGQGAVLHVKTRGCDRVPFKMEFCFSAGGLIVHESFLADAEKGGSILVGKGEVTVASAHDSLTVGPAFLAHRYARDMRGSLPQSSEDYTVYFTGYTNLEQIVEIRAGGGINA